MNPFQWMAIFCMWMVAEWALNEMVFQYRLFNYPYQLGKFHYERRYFYEQLVPAAIEKLDSEHNEAIASALRKIQDLYWRAEI